MRKILDLSENNGYIDFSKIKQSGINDVILRIGWIGNKNNHTIDKRFEEYYKSAKANGLNVGYYVFSYCLTTDAIKGACTWIRNKLVGKVMDLPIFLDLEDDENSSTRISFIGKENLTNQALEFCRYFKEQGVPAGVYASKDWFNRLIDVNKIINFGFKIWLAEWGVEKPTVNYKVDLWQYTSSEEIRGIEAKRFDASYCLCNCNEEEMTGKPSNGDDIEMKIYQNGSSPEPVFGDTNLTIKVGTINKYEKCDCLGIFENRAMVRYKVDDKNNYKIGFVKWLGGVQN